MKNIQSKSIVFITGAFVHHHCWEPWKSYFEEKGFRCIAPPWPHKDASPEELRNRQPDPLVASNRLASLTEYFADIVRTFPEKPILIGHSIGGLIVQLLLQRDLAEAGVAIHSVPPQGIFTFKISFFRSGWGPLGFFTSVKESFQMSFKEWQYAFTNGMNYDDQKESYYKMSIPESKQIVRDTITHAAMLDFTKPHPPLLITSGSEDHTIPASLNYSNYKKYNDNQSITDYKEFKGRNHFVLGQSTWQEDAHYIIQWLKTH